MCIAKCVLLNNYIMCIAKSLSAVPFWMGSSNYKHMNGNGHSQVEEHCYGDNTHDPVHTGWFSEQYTWFSDLAIHVSDDYTWF